MSIKYAIFNHEDGGHTFVDTREEAIEAFWQRVFDLAKYQFNGTAYMVVETFDDGSEVWRNDAGAEIDPLKTKEQLAKEHRDMIDKLLNISRIESPTKVEVLP